MTNADAAKILAEYHECVRQADNGEVITGTELASYVARRTALEFSCRVLGLLPEAESDSESEPPSEITVTVTTVKAGDIVSAGSTSGTFISQTTHPLYGNLRLVTWYMGDGSMCFDALASNHELGTVIPAEWEVRRDRLRAALSGSRGE